MNKAYLFLYNDEIGSREDLTDFIDGQSTILNWKYELPNCFYLVSEKSAQELSELVRGYSGKRGRFLIMECSTNRQGLLDPDTWKFLREKKKVD